MGSGGGPITQGAPQRRPAPAQPQQATAPQYRSSHDPRVQRQPNPAPGFQQQQRPAPQQQQRPAQQPQQVAGPSGEHHRPRQEYSRPQAPTLDQSGFADLGQGVRGKVNERGQLLLVITPGDAVPTRSGRADVLASTDKWVRLDNLLGAGHALSLALTRSKNRGGRG